MFDVPVYTSERPTDCGATCLKMLLEFYGKVVDLDELNRELNTRLTGCTLADLKRVSIIHGLDPYLYQMDAEELLRQDRPGIIWWKFNHFVVFCGLNDAGDPVINNPDRGQYRIPINTFKTMYSEMGIWNGDPQDLING